MEGENLAIGVWMDTWDPHRVIQKIRHFTQAYPTVANKFIWNAYALKLREEAIQWNNRLSLGQAYHTVHSARFVLVSWFYLGVVWIYQGCGYGYEVVNDSSQWNCWLQNTREGHLIAFHRLIRRVISMLLDWTPNSLAFLSFSDIYNWRMMAVVPFFSSLWTDRSWLYLSIFTPEISSLSYYITFSKSKPSIPPLHPSCSMIISDTGPESQPVHCIKWPAQWILAQLNSAQRGLK